MIYVPMTADILTPGHIKVIRELEKLDDVTVGVLTDEALKGYKKTVVPFEARFFILEQITDRVVRQDELNPYHNLRLYGCRAIYSGDGYEPEEEEAIQELNIEKIKLDFPKEYSSTKVKERIKRS